MKRNKRAHRWAFPLGIFLVALAIVGAVTLVNLSANGVRQLLNNSEEKEKYEAFLSNIVVHDPDPFDSPEQVQENVGQLLDICLWTLLLRDNANPEDYPMDEAGNLEVDLEDVAATYRALFGIDPPTYVTVEGTDFDFVYDPEHKVYRVPVTAALEIYAPRVRDIKKTGSSVELTVEYIASNDIEYDSLGRPLGFEGIDPTKTMVIKLLEQDNPDLPWRVEAIRQSMGADYMEGAAVLG